MTVNQVVSQLGGLFSLWTGISIVMIITWLTGLAPRFKELIETQEAGTRIVEGEEDESDSPLRLFNNRHSTQPSNSDSNLSLGLNLNLNTKRIQLLSLSNRPDSMKQRIRRARDNLTMSDTDNLFGVLNPVARQRLD